MLFAAFDAEQAFSAACSGGTRAGGSSTSFRGSLY
jgi:hypothetical protein